MSCPLMKEVIGGVTPEVEELLKQGHSPNSRDEKGRTSLHWAAVGGSPKILRLLLEAGALVNARDAFGHTPLLLAVSKRIDFVQMLLDWGADPNIKKNDGTTPLHKAVQLGRNDMVELLDKYGARLNTTLRSNAKTYPGATPLHIAAKSGMLGVCKTLLLSGCDLNPRDAKGKTPLGLAKRSTGPRSSISSLLEKHGGTV